MGNKNNKRTTHCWFGLVAALISVAVVGAGCEKPPPCIDHSKKPLEDCRLAMDKLQSDNLSLKRQLALAKATPGSINVDDPSVTEINGKKPYVPEPQEGTLSQTQVVAAFKKNIPALRKCYERSMKKHEALQMSKLNLTIEFKVQPSGKPTGLYIRPSRIQEMTDCMKKSIKRWRFPTFTGQPVGVVYPLTLSPRK